MSKLVERGASKHSNTMVPNQAVVNVRQEDVRQFTKTADYHFLLILSLILVESSLNPFELLLNTFPVFGSTAPPHGFNSQFIDVPLVATPLYKYKEEGIKKHNTTFLCFEMVIVFAQAKILLIALI